MTFQVRAKYGIIKGQVSTDLFSSVCSDIARVFATLDFVSVTPLMTEWTATLSYKYTSRTRTLNQSITCIFAN